MEIRFLSLANQEVDDSVQWYEEHRADFPQSAEGGRKAVVSA
jgi:hypothetical protein